MSDVNVKTKINIEALNAKKGRNSKKILEYIKITEDRIEKSLKVTKYLNEALVVLKQFPFKEGDVVFVKEKEKGIISGIEWGDDGIAAAIDEKFVNRFYAVVATQNGYEKVLLSEIIPYNSSTKVLYERKNE